MWSRIAPSESAGPQARPAVSGMWPYGAWRSRIRSAPTTPAKPTSITPRGVSRLRPIRSPPRKTASPASSQTGHERAGFARRPRKPIHDVRTTRYASGSAPSDALMKMWPRLKNSSENPKESSASRSAVCHERIRRRSTSPRKKTTLSAVHIHQALRILPPNEPTRPRAIPHAT